MESDLPIPRGPTIPGAELIVEASRSSGPGGQHVNTTSSRITLRWSVVDSAVLTETQRAWLMQRLASRLTGEGTLLISVETARSQHRNRELARTRLVEVVSKALARPRPRRATRPTKASKVRRLEAKKRRGAVKANRRSPKFDA